jgi:dihydroxy-acid dehydratase
VYSDALINVYKGETMKRRSAEWFAGRDEIGPQSRSVLRTLGWSPQFFEDKPVIGIANSWSELNNCHLGLRLQAEAVKRGVIAAGGVPLEFPSMSLGEELMKPSAMLYRNLLAMEIEETARAYPLDGLVLLGGCDKSIPAHLMAAASADLPTVLVCAGPKTAGRWRGIEVGSGTDLWRYWDQYRAGQLDEADWQALEASYSQSAGTCNTMGTASTMAVLAEVLGMMLPGSASIPANDTRRLVAAELSGRRAVAMVAEGLRPSAILTPRAFHNALHAFASIGGSTNAVIHLIAIAGRRCIPLTVDDFDRCARETPVLVDVQPSGAALMAAFDAAGGVPALLAELADRLDLDALTVGGQPLRETIASPNRSRSSTIRALNTPLRAGAGLLALHGNLAPRGAILRSSTASQHLLHHRGPALVFDSYADMLERIDDPDLPATRDTVLVLRNVGTIGVPGLPEWGSIPVPAKLLRQGITDVVRISDGRMSGTSSGTIVLHVTPEAAAGGPLALVEDGDLVELDGPGRRLSLLVAEATLERRRARWKPPVSPHRRGYPRLFIDQALQPDQGCDFAFLRPDTPDDLPFVPPTVGRS